MPKVSYTLVFELFSALLLFALGIYIGLTEQITFPSRYGASENTLGPPATYFVSSLPIAFGLLIYLRRFFPKIAKLYGAPILAAAVVLFLAGYVLM